MRYQIEPAFSLIEVTTDGPRDSPNLSALVVKASASRAEDSGFPSLLSSGDFSGSSHTSDLKIGTPVPCLSTCHPLLTAHWRLQPVSSTETFCLGGGGFIPPACSDLLLRVRTF